MVRVVTNPDLTFQHSLKDQITHVRDRIAEVHTTKCELIKQTNLLAKELMTLRGELVQAKDTEEGLRKRLKTMEQLCELIPSEAGRQAEQSDDKQEEHCAAQQEEYNDDVGIKKEVDRGVVKWLEGNKKDIGKRSTAPASFPNTPQSDLYLIERYKHHRKCKRPEKEIQRLTWIDCCNEWGVNRPFPGIFNRLYQLKRKPEYRGFF